MSSDIDLRADPGFTLFLQVLDDEGAPVPGAAVELIRHAWSAQYCTQPMAASGAAATDASGRLVIRGLDARMPFGERFVVAVRHPAFAEGLVDRPEALLRDGPDAHATVRLTRGHTLRGAVRGLPEQIFATLTTVLEDAAAPHAVLRSATTAADGSFEITALVPGEHTLRVQAEGFLDTIRSVRVPDDEPLALAVTRGRSLRGSVLGPNGVGAAGAIVTASWRGRWGLRQTVTRASGAFLLEGLPTDVELAIEAQGSESEELLAAAVLTPGTIEDSTVLDARARGTWTGVLVDHAGDPLARLVTVGGKSSRGISWRNEAVGGRDGRFTLRLPPGKWDLSFRGWESDEDDAPVHALLRGVEVEPGEVREGLRLRGERPFPVEIHVLDAETAAPIPHAAVTADPDPIWSLVWTAEADDRGVFRIPHAVPTSCRVRADAPGSARAEVRAELARGMGPIVVRLAVRIGRSLR